MHENVRLFKETGRITIIIDNPTQEEEQIINEIYGVGNSTVCQGFRSVTATSVNAVPKRHPYKIPTPEDISLIHDNDRLKKTGESRVCELAVFLTNEEIRAICQRLGIKKGGVNEQNKKALANEIVRELRTVYPK